MQNDILKSVRDYILILVASVFYGMGVSLFLDPNNISPGGITGIAMILSRIIPLHTGMLYLLINIPILAAGSWKFGIKFLSKTIFAVFFTSLFTDLLVPFGAATDNPLLAALAGGLLLALGIGIIFRTGGATGGTDIIVRLLRLRYRHLKAGFLLLVLDAAVVGLTGFLLHDLDLTLYALLTVFVSDRAVDYVVYGGDEAKMFHIITDRRDAIGTRLLEELEVGCTYLKGTGGWTNTPKDVILVVVYKRIAPRVEEIVKSEDPAAFIIESHATEIYGEGYKDLFNQM